MQMNCRRILYTTEIAAAVASAALFVLTLMDPRWIETVFDESPDGGDGSLERWLLLGTTFVGALIAALLARRSRRRLQLVQDSPLSGPRPWR